MTSGVVRSNWMSPNSSDDEIFLPNLQSSVQNGPPLQKYGDSSADVNWGAAQFSQLYQLQSRNLPPENENSTWNDSQSLLHADVTSDNSYNNRPEVQHSFSNRLSSRSHDSDSVVSEFNEKHAGRGRERQASIVDGLLHEIYDRWHGTRADSFDSDTFTECSSTSEVFLSRWDSYEADEQRHSSQLSRTFLESQSTVQLKKMVADMQRSISQTSGRLVRQLRRRDRRLAKLQRNCDVVTAILQAASLKRQVDTKMKFSLEPPPGQSAFEQWKDAMKAVGRLPMGIPPEFRRKVWLSLADHYIGQLKLDWHKTVRFAFNERSNPDDDKLGLQIVKDLHRTGCSSFSGQDNEEERAVLKRVLLAYARWNKRVGYCQGFNVIAALLLDVTDRKEDDALKVMIYLIDRVLPESYFDNNLRALSVDMAVFRDLLHLTFPTLSKHLDRLQHAAQDVATGASYEPPLTNVFTMQWFLTLFATCLPKDVVLRVWDAILLEGSEVLLRTALCIWGKLARRIMTVTSADEFYSLMGELSSDMMQGGVFNGDDIVKAIYTLAPFPFPQMTDLREKYTYNIRPFSNQPTPSKQASRIAKAVLYSDEDDMDDDEIRAIACIPGMGPVQAGKGKGEMIGGSAGDISLVGPGVYGSEPEVNSGVGRDAVCLERMSTDITALKLQYEKLRQRQRQAHIIIAAAASAKKKVEERQKVSVLVPHIETPTAMNHLFVGKALSGRNRMVTDGPRIAASSLATHNSLPTKQLHTEVTVRTSSKERLKACGRAKGCHMPYVSSFQTDRQASLVVQNLAAPANTEDDCRNDRLPEQVGDEDSTIRCLKTDASIGREESSAVARSTGVQQAPIRKAVDTISPSSGSEDTAGTSTSNMFGDDDDVEATAQHPEASLGCQHSPAEYEEQIETKDSCLHQDRLHITEVCWQETSSPQQISEDDSGVILSSPTHGSATSSPEKRAGNCKDSCQQLSEADLQKVQTQNEKEDANLSCQALPDSHVNAGSCDSNQQDFNYRYQNIARSLSAPQGILNPMVRPSTLPISSSTASLCVQQASSILLARQYHPSAQSCQLPSSSPVKTSRPFDPFPVKHVNTNRAKTGLKLGLYTPSMLEQIQGQLLGGLQGRKSRNASS